MWWVQGRLGGAPLYFSGRLGRLVGVGRAGAPNDSEDAMTNGMLRRASEQERAKYLTTQPVYGLYGWLTVDGHVCAVEDLRAHGSKASGDPQFEVMAPSGFHFMGDYTHSRLCLTLREVVNVGRGAHFEACSEGCR